MLPVGVIIKLAKLGDGPEIFHTIQGEGVSVGAPAVFIRSSRCNLHCHWCDTDHTWNFEGTPWKHEKNTKYQKSAVTWEMETAAAAERILSFDCSRTIITGGEPLLQESAFLEVIQVIRQKKPAHQFEVETNGTRIPCPEFAAAVDQFNVSPKLANSGMEEILRIRPDALRFYAANPKAWFKFVVASADDLQEIKELMRLHDLPREKVILMPEGRTSAELDRIAPWLAECCRDCGFRFSDRLHIRLWGDKRGV
ncbi:7-carboxy-7-deazaguanine synthase QueE [Luteolibacter pohnpeiensis]|uniref:7-carboxy-7-deazaguanine synthase n=2 Tax=Luteolibacter pohnpeiensis TaxID=454153 RepID=A0A934SAD8_9BACT|nr:7-carboxy-7-deazaguanine synthase QueE [Luteolibacter pohnpeiensis]